MSTHTHTRTPLPLRLSEKPLKHLTFHLTSSAEVVPSAFHPLAPNSPNKRAHCLLTPALLPCRPTAAPFCVCHPSVTLCVFILVFRQRESVSIAFLCLNKGSAEARSSDSQRRGDSRDGDRWDVGCGDRQAGCRQASTPAGWQECRPVNTSSCVFTAEGWNAIGSLKDSPPNISGELQPLKKRHRQRFQSNQK